MTNEYKSDIYKPYIYKQGIYQSAIYKSEVYKPGMILSQYLNLHLKVQNVRVRLQAGFFHWLLP